jgi:hypothetical protein
MKALGMMQRRQVSHRQHFPRDLTKDFQAPHFKATAIRSFSVSVQVKKQPWTADYVSRAALTFVPWPWRCQTGSTCKLLIFSS